MADVPTASDWAQLIDLAITRREVHLEQLQLYVAGALRHPALVSKDGACLWPRRGRTLARRGRWQWS